MLALWPACSNAGFVFNNFLTLQLFFNKFLIPFGLVFFVEVSLESDVTHHPKNLPQREFVNFFSFEISFILFEHMHHVLIGKFLKVFHYFSECPFFPILTTF